MIIWLASYPRSGNTLLRIVLKTVFDRQTYSKYDDVHDIGADAGVREEVGHQFLGDTWPVAYRRMVDDPAAFLVKTHDGPEDDGKAIYVVRDGRSACRSFYHYLRDFPDLDDSFGVRDVVAGFTPFGSWGDHLDSWQPEKRPDTLLLKYEDLIADPQTQIDKISRFTGLTPLRSWQNDFEKLHALNPRFFRAGAGNDAVTALDPLDAKFFWAQHGDWMNALGYPGAPRKTAAGTAVAFRHFVSARGREFFDLRERVHHAEKERQRLFAAEAELGSLRQSLAQTAAELTAARAESETGKIAVAEVVTLEALLEKERATLHGTIGDLRGHQREVIELDRRLYEAHDSLKNLRESSRLQVESLNQQLASERDNLHRTIGDLHGHQMQVIDLDSRLHLSNDALKQLQESTGIELESLRRQLVIERDNLNRTIGDLLGHQQVVIDLSARLDQNDSELRKLTENIADLRQSRAALENRIGFLLAGSANRRSWPFGIPDSLPLPATLPGGKPWPRISVVTASFNQGRYIEQTILSVLNQNYPNLEYILIDGGSTDETMSIVDRYAGRIDFVISEKDDGQSDAINKGFARATGELFTWLNSDDMLESGALAAMAMAFHTSGADMVAGVCTLHTDGTVVGRHVTACAAGKLPLDNLLDLDRRWLRGQFFYQPEVMFTRDIWLRSGGSLDVGLHYSMDYDLWLRFADAGATLHVTGRPIAQYRVHEQQKTYLMEDYKPELTSVRDRFLDRTGRVLPGSNLIDCGDGGTRTHLRVVFFNDLGNVGGAAIAHQRLAASIALAGHVVMPIGIRPALLQCELSNEAILQAIADREPDIVFVGNIHSARLRADLVGQVSGRWTTIQVLHDLNSLTGRCAYTGTCEKYRTGCDDTCPTADEYPALDRSLIAGAWRTKDDALTGDHPPILAAVSRWTADFARRRFDGESTANQNSRRPPVAGHESNIPPLMSIHYGLPVDRFKPRDRSTCREMLGLPLDRFIVLFSSSDLADKRKGLDHLIAALSSIQIPELLAVCIGTDDSKLADVGFETRMTGYVKDDKTLAMLYSAADLFVGPSLVETFGQVFIEAAACGTPSVGYAAAGGVADAVANGISGRLADAQIPEALAAEISRLHDDPAIRRDMAAWGRLWVENEFSFHSSCQQIFSELNRLGLIDKLDLSPKVRFTADLRFPEPLVYLNPLPADPTEHEREMMKAREWIAAVEAERDRLREQIRSEFDPLRADRDRLAESMVVLERERVRIESDGNARAAQLEVQGQSFKAERDERDALIQQMIRTRTWRLVNAIYPVIRKPLNLFSGRRR